MDAIDVWTQMDTFYGQDGHVQVTSLNLPFGINGKFIVSIPSMMSILIHVHEEMKMPRAITGGERRIKASLIAETSV